MFKTEKVQTIIAVLICIILLLTNSNVYANSSMDNAQLLASKNIVIENITLPQQIKLVNYTTVNGKDILTTNTQVEKISQMEKQIEERRIAKEKEEHARLERLKVTVETTRQTNFSNISVYTDLSVMNTITVNDMNRIIDYWNSKCDGGTPFKGQGQAFIDASKSSGLDPVYILSHAALESGWGKSQIARDKYNYFGIQAFDSSPYESSLNMADNMYGGIIEGAKWISRNYYSTGQTSLYTMRYNNGHHEYCTSDSWMYDIAYIMQTSYNLIQS